jgi:hypothetical protein
MRRRAQTLKDLSALTLLVVLNPILYSFGSSPRFFPPDTIKYLTMAKELASEGFLRVEGMGHVSNLTILPPLYPALIAVGPLFTDHLLAWSESISSLSLLLAAIPLYLLLSATASRLIAFGVVALIQLSGVYFDVAFWPLTEGLFILMASLTLYAAHKSSQPESRRWVAVVSGLLAALTFLSRQVGLVMILVPLAPALLGIIARDSNGWRPWASKALWTLAGFFALVAPYSLELYRQTGHYPYTQSGSTGAYLVEATPADRARIEMARREVVQEYDDVYGRRRVLRELNAAGSEMLGNVVTSGAVEDSQELLEQTPGSMLKWISNRVPALLRNLRSNLDHLKNLLGPMAFWLFTASLLAPFSKRSGSEARRPINVIWLWILIYLVALSWVTGLVERYVVVLLPFAVAQVGVSANLVFQGYLRNRMGRWARPAGFGGLVLLFCLLSLSTPRFFNTTTLHDKLWEDAPSLDPVRDLIAPGDPVFTIQPMEAYFVGGLWRTLPNDDLNRIAHYGRLTGVRWILVSRIQSVLDESKLYSKADWYRDPLLSTRPDLPVTFRASTTDGLIDLFEIR